MSDCLTVCYQYIPILPFCQGVFLKDIDKFAERWYNLESRDSITCPKGDRMKQVSKTDFSAMTSPELAAINEVLEIVSNKTVIGYFVPVEQWEADRQKGVGDG